MASFPERHFEMSWVSGLYMVNNCGWLVPDGGWFEAGDGQGDFQAPESLRPEFHPHCVVVAGDELGISPLFGHEHHWQFAIKFDDSKEMGLFPNAPAIEHES